MIPRFSNVVLHSRFGRAKKRHTRKHITGSTRKKRVIILTKAKPGSMHSKKQLDEETY
jgi:hypothetical protein